MNYSFIASLPEGHTSIDSFLRRKGFSCNEIGVSDVVQWRRYYIEFQRWDSNVCLRLVLRFEEVISDSPTATYDENHQLTFNDAFITVYDRQMLEDGQFMGEPWYDEETESVRKIDSFPISPSTFADIEGLIDILR